MTDTKHSAIEAGKAAAIAAGKGEPAWSDCVTDDEWRAFLLGWLSAIAEDDASVEAVRKSISESQADSDEGPFEAMYDLLSMSENSVHLVTMAAARAVLATLLERAKEQQG
jgi:hypothetical protein